MSPRRSQTDEPRPEQDESGEATETQEEAAAAPAQEEDVSTREWTRPGRTGVRRVAGPVRRNGFGPGDPDRVRDGSSEPVADRDTANLDGAYWIGTESL